MTDITHVLIVDDYADALEIWAIYLTARGFRVTTAADGLTALEEAERLRPDLIVLDLEMPGLSGFDMARRLRTNPQTRDIPLIAATGYSQERQLAMARDAGVDRVIVKPLDPQALVEEIERLLEANVRRSQPGLVGVVPAHENG